MRLTVALLGDAATPRTRGEASWGTWSTHAWTRPEVLAEDPDVVSPQTGTVLVLTPSRGVRAARIAAATIAAVRPDIRVRVEAVPTPLAPLLRAVELVPRDVTDASAVHAGVLDVLRRTVWGAWLPTVSRLERPTPSMRQHLSSWVARGAGFLAVVGETEWVVRLPAARIEPAWRLPKVAAAASGDTYDCQAFGDLSEDALKTLFEIGVSTRPVRRDGLGDGAAAWGSAKAVDLVITPTTLGHDTGTDRLGRPEGHCPACEEPVWAPCCPFCRVTVSSRRVPVAAGAPTDPAAGQLAGQEGAA